MILSRLTPALLILGFSLAAAGCDSSVEPGELEDTTWQLTKLFGQSVSTAIPAIAPHLTFQPEEQSVSGSSGCNQFRGSYQVEANRISLGQIVSTLRGCREGMEIEL